MATILKSDSVWFLLASFIFTVAGLVLLYLAWTMPVYHDLDVYQSQLATLNAIASGAEADDLAQANTAFAELQAQYGTGKWRYSDLAYAALAWAGLTAIVSRIRQAGGDFTTRRALITTIPTVAGLALLLLAFIAAEALPGWRDLMPPWAPEAQLAPFEAFLLLIIIAPVYLALALLPIFFTKRVPGALFTRKGRGWPTSLATTAVYLLPALFALWMILSFATTGGFAASTGGAILLWSLLNGRAIVLGPTVKGA